MTTPITKEQFTKEQLQRIIEISDEVISAVAGTNEDVHQESDEMIRLWDCLNDVVAPPEVVRELARIAQTAKGAEPVYQWRERYEEGGLWEDCTKEQYDGFAKNPECETRVLYTAPPAPVVNAEPVADVVACHKEGEERTCDIRWRRFDVAPGPLFAVAQPVAVVPDEMAISDDMNLYQKSFAQGHNACRAAMLNHSEHEYDMVERVSQPYKLPEEKGASLQLRNLIRKRHAEWSDATFGNVGPIGPLKHLSKEALEAAAEPDDLSEWANMQFLLWDAQRRAGISDGEITAAMEEKLKVNMARQWPEPKDGEPRMHINEPGNSPVIPDGWQLVPVEPTYQMCKAMELPWESPRFPDLYKAMLAAVKK